LHIFILQREGNIHGPDSWVSKDEFFYFFAHWCRVARSTFLQFTLPLRGALFVQRRSKWPHIIAILWQSLGKWPTLLSKWMVIVHQLHFFAHWCRVARSTFLQFTLPPEGPPFCAGVLKMTPYYGDFVTIVFWSLWKWPTLLSKWMVIDHQGHYNVEVQGSPCAKFLGFEFFDIFWKN